MGSVDDHLGYFFSWHTGDSQATEVIVAPLLARLSGNTIVLTIHALGGLALALLAEEHDRVLRALSKVDLDAIEGVLHGLGGHVVFP